jgi:hypothetical protein
VTTDLGMGLSWNWKTFDRTTSSYAAPLSSDLNAYIDWGFYLRWAMTPQTALYTGLDYTHRSNGGVVQSDQGINVIGPKVALQYNFAPAARKVQAVDRPPFQPGWEFGARHADAAHYRRHRAGRRTPAKLRPLLPAGGVSQR